MVLVEHLIGPATLPKQLPPAPPSLSILSYNVLLPNSVDGWWTYKMYMPPISLGGKEEKYPCKNIASWEYRKQLLQNRIQWVNADVVCLQEVSPESFVQDFAFMKELGYDGNELFKKGRFRPATFWKTSSCTLASPPVHRDRCLLTAFQITNDHNNKNQNGNYTLSQKQKQKQYQKHWFVCNCHLQAGKQGPRRVRQIHDGIKGVLTLARKLKEPEPEKSIQLIVCGDMNGGPEGGAVRYLEDGFVDETFLEDNEPVTSSRKDLPLAQPLLDATLAVSRKDNAPPPPTLVVAEIMTNLMEHATYDNPVLSPSMIDRLTRIYKTLATSPDGVMSRQDVEQWLVRINQQLGRGDEYRNAAIQMGWQDDNNNNDKDDNVHNKNNNESWQEKKKRIQIPSEGVLTLEGFIEVYRKELELGKFWGIAHDMARLGDPLPDAGLYTARFDRMYCSAALQPIAVLDFLSNQPCPNDEEPSDHLPVAATFQPKMI